MISIDFSLAIALFIGVLLVLLFLSWIFSKKQKDKDLNLDPRFIWFCSICTYTYVNTKEEVISICPRCGNYNKK
ncbi:MAG: hypothetical protein AMJ95_09285 [Omnitrophica WOR_2 bacterium SM23_72]|nr:MAG: hypothetical protein AMJ95_09285 [Omnitrophica WOR_2 bacterium SM23_72]